jgi:hypothetical protein
MSDINNIKKIDVSKPFNNIVYEMASLYEKKNQDYGNAFGELFNEYGLNYSIMHLHEKLNRIKSVHKNNNANNESIKDSLIDLANYAVMSIVELNKQFDINNVKSNNDNNNDVVIALYNKNNPVNDDTNAYGFPKDFNI